MHRIDSPGFLANGNGAGKNAFTNGDAAAGVRGTLLEDVWLNAIQEELCNVIEGAGHTLLKTDKTQLYRALLALQLPLFESNMAEITAPNSNTPDAGVYRKSSGRMVVAGCIGTGPYTSDDFVTYTARTWGSSFNNINQYGLIDTGSLFVMSSVDMIQTSADGVTWTAITPTGFGGSSRELRGIAYSPTLGMYVCAPNLESGKIFRSTNLTAWTLSATPFSGVAASYTGNNQMLWTGTSFLMVLGTPGVGNGGIARSTDGINWTVVYTSTSAAQATCIAAGVGGVSRIAVGLQGSGGARTIYSDDDGLTWSSPSAIHVSNLGAAVCSMACDDGLWVMGVGNLNAPTTLLTNGHGIFTSRNGKDWTRRDNRGIFSYFSTVIPGRKWILGGNKTTTSTNMLQSTLFRY